MYHAYLSDAAKWNGGRGKRRIENLTDAGINKVISYHMNYSLTCFFKMSLLFWFGELLIHLPRRM